MVIPSPPFVPSVPPSIIPSSPWGHLLSNVVRLCPCIASSTPPVCPIHLCGTGRAGLAGVRPFLKSAHHHIACFAGVACPSLCPCRTRCSRPRHRQCFQVASVHALSPSPAFPLRLRLHHGPTSHTSAPSPKPKHLGKALETKPK